MAIPAGETFLVYWKGNAFMAQLTAEFSSGRDSRDISHKQSGKFGESRPQRINSTISLTALLDDNASIDIVDIWDDYQSGDVEDLELSQEVNGGYEVSGKAYISNIGLNTPDQENTEVPIDFTFTGEHDIDEIDE